MLEDSFVGVMFTHLAKFGISFDDVPYKGWICLEIRQLVGKLLTGIHSMEHEALRNLGLQEYEEEFLIAQRGVLEAAKAYYEFRMKNLEADEKKTLTADLLVSVSDLLEAEKVLASKKP